MCLALLKVCYVYLLLHRLCLFTEAGNVYEDGYESLNTSLTFSLTPFSPSFSLSTTTTSTHRTQLSPPHFPTSANWSISNFYTIPTTVSSPALFTCPNHPSLSFSSTVSSSSIPTQLPMSTVVTLPVLPPVPCHVPLHSAITCSQCLRQCSDQRPCFCSIHHSSDTLLVHPALLSAAMPLCTSKLAASIHYSHSATTLSHTPFHSISL